jgi:cation diffusion facilitator family transporter
MPNADAPGDRLPVPRSSSLEGGLRVSAAGLALNVVLAAVKVVTGVVGNAYALIADGIESTVDVASSLIAWGGLRVSARPADRDHPYGHGKAESVAGVLVAGLLLVAAALVALQSVREIATPHHAPAPYTLAVLVGIVLLKAGMYRWTTRTGDALGSSSLRAEAWHHRSDALTSVAAFLGISLALLGGAGWETADDWAALAACGVIVWNGARLLRPSLGEVMDEAPPPATLREIRAVAGAVPGVVAIEKCRVRKSGTGYLTDIHVEVDGALPVREGHRIAHRVADALRASDCRVVDVVVHVEPADPSRP